MGTLARVGPLDRRAQPAPDDALATHIEHDPPQTLYAARRASEPTRLRCFRHGLNEEYPLFVERVLDRLRAAGFGVTAIGHDRVLVTPGEVDVEGPWRRARAITQELCVNEVAFQGRLSARRLAAAAVLEAAARAEAERVAIGEELRHVDL